MKQYRKKPVVIEAIKWDGLNLREVIDFTGLHESASKWTWEEYCQVVKIDGLKIFTLEGKMLANIGDWIIKGVNGEFYPCKPDIFEKTYETVSESPTSPPVGVKTAEEILAKVLGYSGIDIMEYELKTMCFGDGLFPLIIKAMEAYKNQFLSEGKEQSTTPEQIA